MRTKAGEVKHNEAGRASQCIERMEYAAHGASALLLLMLISGFWTFIIQVSSIVGGGREEWPRVFECMS